MQLLGWWNNETKSYRLKGEKGKLIAFKDARFIEDDLLSNLAIVNIYKISITLTDIDKFVDNAVVLQTQSLVLPI